MLQWILSVEKIGNQKPEVRNQGVRRRVGITPPPYYVQRSNGWAWSMQMPIFKGVLNIHPLERPFSNGPPDDRPGVRKKGCVCVGAQCNPFWAVVPG
jgi:hypothetical protein